MSVSEVFEKARAEGRAVAIGCMPAGFPTVEGSIASMIAMAEAGIDVIEVELPYSDPVMDGPVIQKASDIALAGGVRTRDTLRAIEAVARTGVPVVLMTYWNPIERYGVDAFARDLAAAGGTGLITPDLIPDEAEEWLAASDAYKLDRTFLVSPSSTDERLAMTVAHCRGFVYATAVMGVTGARDQTSAAAPALVARVRAVTDLPVGVGLGVRDGAQAAEVGSFADGVIVGSALVRCVLDAPDEAAAHAALAPLAAHPRGGGLAAALRPHVAAAHVCHRRFTRELVRVSPEWCWRDFRLGPGHGRNHGSVARLERAALRWAVYRNFTPAQERRERKRHYRGAGLSPLARAGVPPGDASYLDALAI
jgi:tryptophan synthase alpha chain